MRMQAETEIAQAVLISGLQSDEVSMRRVAAEALNYAATATEQVRLEMTEAAEDDDFAVRWHATQYLER